MIEYRMGERYLQFKNHEDNIKFDISDDGADVLICWNKPSAMEREQFRCDKPLEVRYVVLNGVIYLMFKFGNTNWMDAPYSPHLSLNLTKRIMVEDDYIGLALNVWLFDSSTGELLEIRLVGLGNKLTKSLVKEIENSLASSFERKTYDSAIKNTYLKYSTKDMVKMAPIYFRIYQQ